MQSLIKKIQEERRVWSEKNFPDQTTWQMLLGIVEEVGELSHAHLKESQHIRTTEDHEEKAKDAVGDILIFLLGYCSLRGFDVEKILKETWDEVKKRDWKKHPEKGL